MATKTCVVVDYGIGNVFSVVQALEKIGVAAQLTGDANAIAAADRVILPGVGAFGKAADRLERRKLKEPLLEFIETGRPFLGICVGMQLLMEMGTEFGDHPGLGLVEGTVRKIDIAAAGDQKMRVPLIGWHPLRPGEGADYSRWNGTPLEGIDRESAFYFVHSFAAQLTDPAHCLAVTRHHGIEVTAAVQRDNILGTQFHPERSSHTGLKFLQNFAEV